jgi:hypothetical protein
VSLARRRVHHRRGGDGDGLGDAVSQRPEHRLSGGAWRTGLDDAAATTQLDMNRWTTPRPAARVTGPAVISHSAGGLLYTAGDTRADVPTEAGSLRLDMIQHKDGRWFVISHG